MRETLVALLFAALACSSRDPSTSMGTARDAATAAGVAVAAPAPGALSNYSMSVLPSGKVLVAGGMTAAGVTASAWAFDPDSGRWDPTGAMSTARSWHGAVLLQDGRVLVAGGSGTGSGVAGSLASAEIYDPGARTWSTTGSLAAGRYYHSTTRLPDGRVLVAGGIHRELVAGSLVTGPTASCEIWDPATATWSPAAPLPAGRTEHTATLLLDGGVLVTGGRQWAGTGQPIATALRYDPVRDAWDPVAPLHAARFLHTATQLHDGTVLVAGGSGASGVALASAERYDPEADLWTTVTPLVAARFGHAASLLPDGSVAVSGGGYSSVDSVERFDPTVGTWSGAGRLAVARLYLQSTVLPDGRVLVGPGWCGGATYAAEVDLVDAAVPGWSAGPAPLGVRPSGAAAALLPSGKVLVAGGRGADGIPRADADLLDPNPFPHATAAVPLPAARADFTLSLLPSGKLLAAGGEGPSGVLSRADVLDVGDVSTERMAWTPAAPLSAARASHTATVLADGSVLVVGGRDGVGSPLAAAERYVPRTGAWTAAGATASPRIGHAATLLRDGRVLVTGGVGAGPDEVFDPAALAWSLAPVQAGGGRAHHTATRLLDGRVLVTGGVDADGTALATAAVWDPDGGSSTVASLGVARARHRALLLPSGHVLVTGGDGPSGPLASTELYDPVTRTWRAGPSMATPRSSLVLSLLRDGGALAVGGASGESASDRFAPGSRERWVWEPSIANHPVAVVAGREIGVGVAGVLSAEANSGVAGSSNLNHPLFVLLRADGDGGARAPATRTSPSHDQLTVPAIGSGPAWLFPIVAGALGDGVPVMADPPLGWICLEASQCTSGACVDGVCCDTACGAGAPDCQACSAAAGAPVDGTCAVLASGTTCRAASGACDAPETCTGSFPECPPDVLVDAGTTCRAAAGTCDVAEACTGASADCPANAFAAAGTTCRAPADVCDAAEVCSGGGAECPDDVAATDGAPCGDGGTCRAAVCAPAQPPPRRRGGCGSGGEGAAGIALAALARAGAGRRRRPRA